MKIAQVNVYFKPFMVGGAEWYVYNISKELVRMGHEVDVFTANSYNGKKESSEEVIDGIRVHRLGLSLDLSYRMKRWRGLREALSAKHFDVIHTYDYAQPHSKIALQVANSRNIKPFLTVFDIHSMIPRSWYKQLPMRLIERFSAKGILNSADRVLVRAPPLVDSLVSLGLSREKIIVTPSGIKDESLGSFDGKAFLNKCDIRGSPVVLFFGRLNRLKGPQHLLAVAPAILKEFPNTVFVFVGPDQSGYSKQLERMAKNLGITDRVRFIGPIYDFAEKMQAYASADVFALPTSYEGTSQAIFEAMSAGRPIVSTAVGGIPFQIEDGKEGVLVRYGDSAALRDSILNLLRNKEWATRLGINAKKKVENFTYSSLASRLVEIYRS